MESTEKVHLSWSLLIYEIGNIISSFCGLFSCIYYFGFVNQRKTDLFIRTMFVFKLFLHTVNGWFHPFTNSALRLCQNDKNCKLYKLSIFLIHYLTAPNGYIYKILVRICNVCIFGIIVAQIVLIKQVLVLPIVISEIIVTTYLCYTFCYRIYKGAEFFDIHIILNHMQWPPTNDLFTIRNLSVPMYLYSSSALIISICWMFSLYIFLSTSYLILICKSILLLFNMLHAIIIMPLQLIEKHTMNACIFSLFLRYSQINESDYIRMIKWCNIGIILTLCIQILFISYSISECISFIYLFYVIGYRIFKGTQYFWKSFDWPLHVRCNNNNMGIETQTLLQATLNPNGCDHSLLNDILCIINNSADTIDDIYTKMVRRFDENGINIVSHNPTIERDPDHYFNNWSLTESFKPIKIVYIRTIHDIITEIKYAKENKLKIRPVTYGHSFSPIHGDANCVILAMIPKSLSSINPHFLTDFKIKIMHNSEGISLSKIIVEDYPLMFVEFLKNNVIKIGGSTPIYLYHHLCDIRIKLGLSIPSEPCNVMQLHQSFVGTTAVSSHGSGINTSPMTDYVVGIKFIDANGKIREYRCDKNKNDIKNVCCHLGMLGVVIELEIQYEACYYCEYTPKFIKIDDVFPMNDDETSYSNEYFKDIICNNDYNQFFWFPTTDSIMILSFKKTFNKTNLVRFPSKEYVKQKQTALNKLFGIFKKFKPYLLDSENKTLNTVLTHTLCQAILNAHIDYFVIDNKVNINEYDDNINEQDLEEDEEEKMELIRKNVAQNSFIVHQNIDNNNGYIINDNRLSIPSIDALHPFWGIQSNRVNNVELIIPLNSVINKETNKKEPDIELVKSLYIAGLSLYEEVTERDGCNPFNLVLEMRIIGKSNALLSPFNYKDYEYFCCIETAATSWGIIYVQKYLEFTKELTKKWANITRNHYKNCDILIRPHWAKQWKHFDGNECVSDDFINENENFNSIYDFFKFVYGKTKIKIFNKYRKLHDPNNMFLNESLEKIFDAL